LLSRGVLLVGTQMSGYDITAISFGGGMHPEFISPESVVAGGPAVPNYFTSVKQQAYVLKIPLASRDALVYEFFATQITPYAVAGDMQTSVHIGNYYSQAILIGQSCVGRVSASSTQVRMYARFRYAYPVLVVIAPPPLAPSPP